MEAKEFFGRFDFSRDEFSPFTREDIMGGHSTVDGREVKNVWFADTETGVLRYYPADDGKIATPVGESALTQLTPADFPGREVECPSGGVVSETLRGHVRIFGRSL